MKSSIHRYLVNFALFQAAWFWGVLAPAGWDVVGVALVLAVHLKYFALAGETKFILLAVATGSVVDSLFSLGGVFVYNAAYTVWSVDFIPPWLMLLWAGFAMTINHSLSWLRRSKRIAAVMGAVAGPAAYLGGMAISDKLSLGVPAPVFVLCAAPVWAILCVGLPWLARVLPVAEDGEPFASDRRRF